MARSAGAGAVGAAAAGANPGSAPAVPPTSPWARPTSDTRRPSPAAGAAAAGAAAAAVGREESVARGPYTPHVPDPSSAPTAQAPAASASSAPEAKPLYRPDSSGATAVAPPAPQSRFPQPAAREVKPDGESESAPEETAGPSTAVLPAVPAAAVVAPKPPESAAAAKARAGTARRTRKARLRLSRLDPWSVMKTSFLFSIAAGIMLVVAVYVIWTVLSTSGLFDSVNEIVASVVSTPGDTTPFRIEEYINTQKVMGVSALIACVDVVIFTALATLGSFLYNLAATMLGGLEITLAED